MNEEGACRIIFSEAITLLTAYIINLHIPQKEQTLRARVSWRRGDEIGLSFTAETAKLPDSSELMQRVAQLEAEILKLRRMLKRLKNGAEPDNQPYDDGVAAWPRKSPRRLPFSPLLRLALIGSGAHCARTGRRATFFAERHQTCGQRTATGRR